MERSTFDEVAVDAKELTLTELAKAMCGEESSFDRCHARVFSCLRHDVDAVASKALDLDGLDDVTGARPVAIAAIDLSGFSLSEARPVLFEKDEKLVFWMDVRQVTLPSTKFLLIATPLDSDSEGQNYANARIMIDRVRAVLSIQYGTLATFRLVAEFDFDVDGKSHFGSEWVRRPMDSDMLYFSEGPPKAVVADLLFSPQRSELSDRAISFLAKAFDERDDLFRFTSYWIALEVLCQGTAGKMRAELAKTYGLKRPHDADTLLRFSDISNLRHDALHKGHFRGFRPYQERLMIAYFWDVFLARKGLPILRLAEGLLSTEVVKREIASIKN